MMVTPTPTKPTYFSFALIPLALPTIYSISIQNPERWWRIVLFWLQVFQLKVGIVHRKNGKWINSGNRSTSSGSSWWCDDDQDGSTLLALLKTIPLFYYVTFPFRYYTREKTHRTAKKEEYNRPGDKEKCVCVVLVK